MFEAFGSTLAITLVLVGMTGATVYLFMQRKKTDLESKSADDSARMTFLQAQRLIYEEVRDVCEMALVRKNFTSTIPLEEDRKFPFLNVHMPGTSRKLLINYSGTIVCGFELKDVKILPEASGRLQISLPRSKILDIYADMKSVKVYHKETGIFAEEIKLEEQNALVAANLEEHGQQEIQEGLLDRADANARQLLHSRITNRGLNRNFDVEILTLSNENIWALNAPPNI